MRCLLLLAGVLLALWAPAPWLQQLQVLLLVSAPLLAYRASLRAGLLLVLGFLHAQHVMHCVQDLAVRRPERLLVEARIDSIPALESSGWRFDALVTFPRRTDLLPQRVRFTAPRGAVLPLVGERWQFAAAFSAPAAARQAQALLRDRVSSTARILPGPLNQRLQVASGGLDILRARVADRIDARVADPAAAALLAALAVGVTGDVSVQQWRVFNATGITHLVAISGMHVTFFAMLSMALARLLWRRLPGLAGRLRREAFAASMGVVMALCYALLSGFSVPAQRTVVMLAAFLLVRECARATRPMWSVAAALTAVLLYDPLAALSAGFWLSFMAVAAIVLVAGARLQPAAPLRAALQVQWLVTVALLPATLAIFGAFPAIGIVANIVAIPAFTFLLVPPVLLATAGYLLPGAAAQWCADQLVDLAATVASMLWPVLGWCAELGAAVWLAEPAAAWYLLALPALVLALVPAGRGLRALALGALASIFLLRSPRPPLGELWIDVLDVGTSAAVLLRTTNRLVLYGTGEKFGSAGRTFDARVLPQVRRSGYAALDLWLPGHPGRDVQAALLRASAQLPLRRVEVPAGTAPAPELLACQRRAWRWDGMGFSVEPQAAGRGCLLSVAVAGRRLALAFDAGGDAIQSELHAQGAVDVLLLPRTASSAARTVPRSGSLLLASVASGDWDSAAWRQLRQHWAASGAIVLSTATEGSIRLRLTSDGRVRRYHPMDSLPGLATIVFGYHARPCGKLC